MKLLQLRSVRLCVLIAWVDSLSVALVLRLCWHAATLA